MRISKPKVYIGIPTYSGKPWYKNTESLMGTILCMKELGWDAKLVYIPNDPILPSVRNKLVADFYASECSHLFMIDDDIAWEPKGFINMVRVDKEVIAGICPIRQGNGFAVEKGEGKDGDLIELNNIGAAFLCISRQAITKMIKKYPELECETFNSWKGFGYNFFSYEIIDGVLQGEDVTFCKLWKQIDAIWGYPDIEFEHLGEKVIKDNYKKQNVNNYIENLCTGLKIKRVNPQQNWKESYNENRIPESTV